VDNNFGPPCITINNNAPNNNTLFWCFLYSFFTCLHKAFVQLFPRNKLKYCIFATLLAEQLSCHVVYHLSLQRFAIVLVEFLMCWRTLFFLSCHTFRNTLAEKALIVFPIRSHVQASKQKLYTENSKFGQCNFTWPIIQFIAGYQIVLINQAHTCQQPIPSCLTSTTKPNECWN